MDAGNGYHPYTTPSLYAYLQLLIFLNALACLTVWSEKLEQELDNMKDVSLNKVPYFKITRLKNRKIIRSQKFKPQILQRFRFQEAYMRQREKDFNLSFEKL